MLKVCELLPSDSSSRICMMNNSIILLVYVRVFTHGVIKYKEEMNHFNMEKYVNVSYIKLKGGVNY